MNRSLVSRLITKLAAVPAIFDVLRWILEGGYRGHRRIITHELLPVDGRILDIGCGTGIYARDFPPERYTGIDLSATYTAACLKKYPNHTFLTMDAQRLTFDDATFSAAFISGVLHHLTDEDGVAVIREAVRVIRPGGLLVVWEDVPAPWWNPVGHVIHALDMGRHIRRTEGYMALLKRAVNVEKTSRMRSGFMDYAVFVCRSAKGKQSP